MDNPGSNHFPFEIKDLEPEQNAAIMKNFKGDTTGFIRVGPKDYFMGNMYKHEAANIYNMTLRDTDVFIVTFPRSGTTLTQELIWLVANDLDYEKAAVTPLIQRFPFIEFSTLGDPMMQKSLIEMNSSNEQNLKLSKFLFGSGAELVAGLPSPRFIKSHLPLSLLPAQLLHTSRVVYVARDPRDVAVSLYFLYKQFNLFNYVGEFKDFWASFLEGNVYWCPFFEHIKEAWEMRHHSNMLFIFYEDLLKDLPGGVRRVSEFLGKQLSEQQVQRLCEHLSFDNFKNNKSVNDFAFKQLGLFKDAKEEFIRKGKSGGWRDYFDEEMTRQAERWIADNLRGTDLSFPTFQKP